MPMKLYYDNKTTINLTNNHLKIDYKIDSKELILPYIKFENQVTDMFTKGLYSGYFESNVSKLDMFDMYVQFKRKC